MDFQRRTLKVYATKTDTMRTLPLSDRLLTALKEHFIRYHSTGGSPWLFYHVAADRHAAAGERINDLGRAFKAAVKRAELPEGLWPYDLRHSRITAWVKQGLNLALIQKAAGHASITTTTIYVHLADDGDDLSVLVERPTVPEPARRPSKFQPAKVA